MSYTVQQLATLAGISVRTLHYYDEVKLLSPARVAKNDYRFYEESELLKLQQILFFRELDFSLDDIGRILSSPYFDMKTALLDQKKLIQLKRNRLDKLVQTIDTTIKKINKETIMPDKDLYGSFSTEEAETYAKEAKDRWGNTDAYKQSQERVQKMGKAGIAKVMAEANALNQELATAMKAGQGPKSEPAQKLIARHYNGLRAFYEPNLEMYVGLAKMYVDDPRFAANYEKVATGLAQYLRDGMLYFAEVNKGKKV